MTESFTKWVTEHLRTQEDVRLYLEACPRKIRATGIAPP